MQRDARFAWVVLIPRQPGLRELEDLDDADLITLTREIRLAGRAVRALGRALGSPVEKLNVGALGNIVPQLHIHVVGRRIGDAAWPGPVWGFEAPIPYSKDALKQGLAAALKALDD